jgi:hypothetical protein
VGIKSSISSISRLVWGGTSPWALPALFFTYFFLRLLNSWSERGALLDSLDSDDLRSASHSSTPSKYLQ